MRLVVLLFVSLLMLPHIAVAQSPSAQELDAIVSSRVCPANPTRYRTLTWEQGCGKSYYSGTREMTACVNRVNEINRRINAYNKFISQCSRPKKSDSNGAQKKGGWADRLKKAEGRNQSRNNVEEQNDQSFDAQVNESHEHAKKQQAEWAKQSQREEAARMKQERENARRAKAQYERDLKQLRQRQAQERKKIVEQPAIIGAEDNLPAEFRGKRNYGWCRRLNAHLYGLFHDGQRMCVLPSHGGGCYGCNTEWCVEKWCNE